MGIDVVKVLQQKRSEHVQQIETIDKAIELLDGSTGTKRRAASVRKRMSQAMKDKIGRGVRRALRQRQKKYGKKAAETK